MASDPVPNRVDYSPNRLQPILGSSPTQRQLVEALLEDHPELARSATEVAIRLDIPKGSACRILKEVRDSRKSILLGPVLLQNVRIQGRITPGTSPLDSPSLAALGPWRDAASRGMAEDGKLVVVVPIPPDAEARIMLSENGALELYLSAPRGLTPAEVRTILALLRLPFDREAAPTVSWEMLRDGRSLRFEGIECRTYEDLDGHLIKLYNHTDERGTFGRIEVRSPSVKASWTEIEAFLDGRQPLGRDARIERLTDMVEDLSRGVVRQGKELMFIRKAMDAMRSR